MSYVNSLFTQISGYSIKELKHGVSYFFENGSQKKLDPGQLIRWNTQLAEASSRSKPQKIEEYIIECRNGGKKFIEAGARKLAENYIVYFIDNTAKRKMEQTVLDNELKYRRLFEYSTDGIFILDKTSKILSCNESAKKMLGYESDELIGIIPNEISPKYQLSGSLSKSIINKKIKNIKTAGSENFDWIFLTKKNIELICRIQLFDVKGEGPKLLCAVSRDITEERRAKRIFQARFNIIELSAEKALKDILVKTLDEAELLTGSSIGFFHFLEENQTQILLQVWSTNTTKKMCTAKSDRHCELAKAGVWADAVRQGKAIIHNNYETLEEKHGLPQGHSPIQREFVVPVFRNNKIVAVLGVGNKKTDYILEDLKQVSILADLAWDIALKKKAEEDLRETNRKLKGAQHIGQFGYWQQDLVSNQLFWSKEFFAMLGLEKSAFNQTTDSFFSFVSKEDHSLIDEAFAEALKNKSDYNIIYRMNLPGNITKYIHERGEITYDKKNNPVMAMGTVNDVTQFKKIEIELKESLSEKNTLLRELYHRTKNNMQIINSIIEIERNKITDKTYDQILLGIESKIRSMALIHEKLYCTKDLSSIQVNDYITDLCSLLFSSYSVSSERVSFSISCPEIDLLIDTAIPFGLITNELITNSLKYAFPGTSEGKISIGITKDEDEFIVVDYADNGIGVSKDFSLDSVNTMGMNILVNVVRNQLDGSIDIIPDKGLHYRIKFREELVSTERVK